MTRDEKREAWDAAFWEYLPALFKAKAIGVIKKFPRL
jgi:hypothetical protein